MARCKFCGQEIDWITGLEGKQVSVGPDPVSVIEDGGPDTLLDDVGAAITGRQAGLNVGYRGLGSRQTNPCEGGADKLYFWSNDVKCTHTGRIMHETITRERE